MTQLSPTNSNTIDEPSSPAMMLLAGMTQNSSSESSSEKARTVSVSKPSLAGIADSESEKPRMTLPIWIEKPASSAAPPAADDGSGPVYSNWNPKKGVEAENSISTENPPPLAVTSPNWMNTAAGPTGGGGDGLTTGGGGDGLTTTTGGGLVTTTGGGFVTTTGGGGLVIIAGEDGLIITGGELAPPKQSSTASGQQSLNAVHRSSQKHENGVAPPQNPSHEASVGGAPGPSKPH